MSKSDPGEDWQPSCGLEALRRRALMLRQIRAFFSERGVLEVETPLLCQAVATDPHLLPFASDFNAPGGRPARFYLQPSPEFAMKRLLAAGSGAIYQICKAFRNGEQGRHHNPEFTLLEWYRPGYSLARLIDELDELLCRLLGTWPADSQRETYQAVFLRHVGIDPLSAPIADLAHCADVHKLHGAETVCGAQRSVWLDFLFSHLVQPQLGLNGLVYVHDFPACQAALARLHPDCPAVAERVEAFYQGIELANGFHELTDHREQRRRFQQELAQSEAQGVKRSGLDARLLTALAAGLPACSGVALGLDRVLMLMLGADSLAEVLAFPLARA